MNFYKRSGNRVAKLFCSTLCGSPAFNRLLCCFGAEIRRPCRRKKNCEQGEVFVRFCPVKKACMGDGGELERALDDVFGIWVTVRSCCEKRIETKLCKSR